MITYNNKSALNEYMALTQRHLIVNESDLVFKTRMHDFSIIPLTPYSHQEYIDQRTTLISKFRNAADSLILNPLNKRDFKLSMFVKDELMKEGKAPRAIQARSVRYNLELACYIRPIEKYLCSRRNLTPFKPTKGLNQQATAAFIIDESRNFREPHYLCLDHSRFDSNININALNAEHNVYKAFYPNDQKLISLLSVQLKNMGSSMLGTKYKVLGTRASGEITTSIGNCIINHLILSDFLDRCGISKRSIIVNGDDSIVIIEKTSSNELDFGVLASYGYMTKLDVQTDNLEDVSFCQSKILTTLNGPILIRDPTRAISRTLHITRPELDSEDKIRRHFHTLAQGELCCNAGVPILQAFYTYMDSMHTKTIGGYDFSLELKKTNTNKYRRITDETRAQFHLAFGISIATQKYWEDYFLGLIK